MAVSFNADILPLFTARDIRCMSRFGVQLSEYSYMSDAAGDSTYADHANARHVYARLSGTSEGDQMPEGGPYWTAAQLSLYEQWMADGFQA